MDGQHTCCMPPAVMQLASAIMAASAALVVAVLTPSVTSLRARRQAINERFDAAVRSVLLAEAARDFPTRMEVTGTQLSADRFEEFLANFREKRLEYFVEKTMDATASLADLAVYLPNASREIARIWNLTAADGSELRAQLEHHRVDALRSERLFRQRRPVAS